MSAARQKKGIFGESGRKRGSRCAGRGFRDSPSAKSSGIEAVGASRTDRCYEPDGTEFVVAIFEGFGSNDHDFVIAPADVTN